MGACCERSQKGERGKGMRAIVQSRKFCMSVAHFRRVLATVTLACLALTGCDVQRPATESIDSEDFSVVMPTDIVRPDPLEITLVAQPPKVRREVVPTPPGRPDVRSEAVPTPPGEPEFAASAASSSTPASTSQNKAAAD